MYLKSVKLKNYRKFGSENNEVYFVDSKAFSELDEQKEDLNIAKTTTLIVGKNNAGKTSVITALDKLINKGGNFSQSDINLNYLESLYCDYKEEKAKGRESTAIPRINLRLVIGLDSSSTDIISNLIQFMNISNVENSELVINLSYEPQNINDFNDKISQIKLDMDNSLEQYIETVKETTFQIRYFDVENELVNDFKLSHLISLSLVEANNVKDERCLSKAFNKIVKYRAKQLGQNCGVDKVLCDFNNQINQELEKTYTSELKNSVNKIESSKHLGLRLSSNVEFENFLEKLVKYEYVENGNVIPENQFGLGYTNLVMIIAEIMDHIEKRPEDTFNSKINLIAIEEPETFMHPQMQENFIKSINEAIITLLKSKDKNINSQLVITTHSPHILNSKIHSGDSFDYINYFSVENENTNVVNLKDSLVQPDNDTADKDNFKFLKKHIKYQVSDLFFSDAAIFVEGITEEVLLKFYLDNDPNLKQYYISVFNINGAHGLVYHNMIKELNVPSLIVTDLDIRRMESEKQNEKEQAFDQIESLIDRETTNQTLIKYNKSKSSIENIDLDLPFENIKIVYQLQDQNIYPTSFEEAFIIANHDNEILKSTLKSIKKNILINVEEDGGILNNSYKLQKKLSNSKSSFANELLFNCLKENDSNNIPKLPKYIADGLDWLKLNINGGN